MVLKFYKVHKLSVLSLLKHEEFEPTRSRKALDMLLIDRNNEFKMLTDVIFWNVPKSMGPIKDSETFILNFCLDVSKAFKRWSGQEPLVQNSDMKALTILRQLSHGKSTMTELAHNLNCAYTLAEEFKVVYRRIE